MRYRRRYVVAFVTLLMVGLFGLLSPIGYAPLPDDLAAAMGINPADIVSTTFSTDSIAGAVSGTVGFLSPTEGTTFAMISSGNAQPAAFPNGWSGTPSNFLSIDNGNPGGTSPQGGTAYDIATLHLALTAPVWACSFSFDFRFMSEEYPEYVGSQFNDWFSAELNGVNFAYDGVGNEITINNNFFNPAITPTGTVFDGTTVLLNAASPVTGGAAFTLDLIVGDVSDAIYDSAVFLDNFQFSDVCIGEPVVTPIDGPPDQVIPEVPFGTVMTFLSMIVALVSFVGFKRFRPKFRPQ